MSPGERRMERESTLSIPDIEGKQMKRTLGLVLLLFVFIGCASSTRDTPTAVRMPPPVEDLRAMATIRKLEEVSIKIIGQAVFDATNERLRKLGSDIAHSGHEERSSRMRDYLILYGEKQDYGEAAAPACFPADAAENVAGAGSELDAGIIRRLIQHHECALSLLLTLVRSNHAATRTLAIDLQDRYSQELNSLRELANQ